MPYLIKVIVSVALILSITEATKRFEFLGALLATLPIISIISMIWIYMDRGDIQQVSNFSIQVFWCVIPSLAMFLSLPLLLKHMPFFPGLIISSMISTILFFLMIWLLRALNYKIGI